ncbi:MAG: hypothetical protein V4438_04245 [Patescibacteria group bacterium]
MNDFSYIDTAGKSQTISAPDSATAIRKATNIDPHSGVQLMTSPTVMTDANVRESTIPNLNAKATTLLAPPVVPVNPNNGDNYGVVGGNGSPNYTNADGSVNYDSLYATLQGSAPVNDANTAGELSLLRGLQTSNDAEYNSTVEAIKSNYTNKEATLKEMQDNQTKGIENSLLLAGSSRYAPISSAGVLSLKQKSDIESLTQLQNEENSLIAQARSAKTSKDYQALSEAMKGIEANQKVKNDLATKISEGIAADNKKARDQQIQASRDGAVADLLQQGVTDPAELLTSLNYDNTGKLVGDFTAKEISDTLGAIAKNNGLGDMKNLTGEVKNFQILKEHGALPDGIDSLPPEQQLAAYLKFIKPGKVLGAPSAGKKVSMTEAKNNSWPLSTVGMSETDILNSLQSETAPKWFVEKLQGQEQQSLQPQFIQTQWDSFRQQANSGQKSAAKSTSSSTDSSQAASYFKGILGDQLSDDDLKQLTDRVDLYMKGGYTYKAAVAQVMKDAGQ